MEEKSEENKSYSENISSEKKSGILNSIKKGISKLSKKELIFIIVLLVLAIFSRFAYYDLRVLHADEGVNWFFGNKIVHGEPYHYDPTNYHGPLFHEMTALSLLIFGTSVFSIRLFPMIFGVFLVLIPFFIKTKDETYEKYGKYIAPILVLLSPSIIYFSRYVAQEPIMIFVTFLSIIFFIKMLEQENIKYFMYITICLAIAFTIKETTVYYVVTFLGLFAFYFKNIIAILKKDKTYSRRIIIFSIIIFSIIWISVFSNLLSYPKGFFDSFLGFFKWGDHAVNYGHNKPFYYYTWVLLQYELPLVLLSLVGGYYAFKNKSIFNRTIALWTLIIFLLYSITPYKTSWLIINLTFPFCILSAIGISHLYKTDKDITKIVLVLSIVYLLCFAIYLNFITPWQTSNTYAYVHTDIDALNLVKDVKSQGNPKILMITDTYWPLPFYFNGMSVNYFGSNMVSKYQDYLGKYTVLILDENQFNKDNLNLSRDPNLAYDHFMLRDGVPMLVVYKKPSSTTSSGNSVFNLSA